MLKQKIGVGHYYELKLNNNQIVAFSVLYGFERGKNKNVYTLMIYTDQKNFEFPIEENLFNKWVKEGRVREITSDEALVHAF